MKHWLYPANPKIYDIIPAFTEIDKTPWPISSKVEIGDIIYIYTGNPYKQILFKCEVLEIDLSGEEVINNVKKYIKVQGNSSKKSFMNLKTIDKYEIDNLGPMCFGVLKENGLKGSIMGPQCLENNKELFEYIKSVE